MTPEQSRALAIVAMGPTRHEYNLGVLSMLGHADMAVTHRVACAGADIALQALRTEQDSNPCDGSFEGLLAQQAPRSARQLVLQAELDDALLRRDAAWSHIEHIIEQHRPLADGVMQDWQP